MFTIDRSTLVIEKLGASQGFTPEGYLSCEGVRIARVGSMIYAPGETPVKSGSHSYVTIDRTADVLFSDATMSSFGGKDVTMRHPVGDDSVGMLDPNNWREVTVGVVLNPRRGQGLDADYLVADLLIKDPEAINAIRDRKLREVSCGYDADYEEIRPGYGRQVRITGNHVALVDRARCGPSCAIGDAAMPAPKKTTFVNRILSAFHAKDEKALLATLDEAPAEEENFAKGEGEREVHVHIHSGGGEAPAAEQTSASEEEKVPEPKELHGMVKDCMSAISQHHDRIATHDEAINALHERLSKVEKGGEGEEEKGEEGEKEEPEAKEEGEKKEPEKKEGEEPEKKEGEGEPEEKTEGEPDVNEPVKEEKEEEEEKKAPVKDAAGLADSWRNALSRAEVIAPGFKPVRTFDAKAKFSDGAALICNFKRDVLRKAAADAKAKPAVDDVFGPGATFDAADYPCRWIDAGFKTVAEKVGAIRNAVVNVKGMTADDARKAAGGSNYRPMTVADLQAMHEKKYPRPGRKA